MRNAYEEIEKTKKEIKIGEILETGFNNFISTFHGTTSERRKEAKGRKQRKAEEIKQTYKSKSSQISCK